jgi:hypothetical protein
VLDPTRLAMAQAFVEGDYGAAAAMAQRFRQLQEEHDRLRMGHRRKRKFSLMAGTSAAMREEPAALPWAGGDVVAGPAGYGLDPGGSAREQSHYQPLQPTFVQQERAAYPEWIDGSRPQLAPFAWSGEPSFDRLEAERAEAIVSPLSAASGFGQISRSAPRSGQASGQSSAGIGKPVEASIDVGGRSAGVPGAPVVERTLEEIAAQTSKPPSVAEARSNAAEAQVVRQKLRQGDGLNGHGYVPTEREVNLMARALFSEFGRVPSWQDMRAGGWTMINRIRPNETFRSARGELGRTLREVLERRNPNGSMQYSFMAPGGVDAPGGSPQWRLSARPEELTGDAHKAWELAELTAREMLSGRLNDPTGGAIFFRHRSSRPDSFQGMRIVPSIYRSPTGDNFFSNHLDEPPRPLPFQEAIIGPRSLRNVNPKISPK